MVRSDMDNEAPDQAPERDGRIASGPVSYVYALGKIEMRLPSLAVEKELAQVMGQGETAGLTDRQALHSVLNHRQNRYLARQVCWVLTIEGLATYILQPRDPTDLDLLLEAVRPVPNPMDVDVVIGLRGPIAPPDMCNGLMLPIVAFDQIYSFDADSLINAIPRPGTIPEDQEPLFRAAATELFWRIMQIADNAGATDEHRALNYLAVRDPAVYATASQAFGRDFSLTEVEVRPSRLSGTRRIVDVILSFQPRQFGAMEQYFVRVDVTEEFPFLLTPISPYYQR